MWYFVMERVLRAFYKIILHYNIKGYFVSTFSFYKIKKNEYNTYKYIPKQKENGEEKNSCY